MAGVPPLKNSAYTFYVSLVAQADTDVFKTTVTLAAGDVQVSKDGGSFSNIGTLPTEIGSTGVLAVALTATEMNADVVTIRFHDAAGDEWQDLLATIETETVQLNDLATAADLATVDGNVDAILADTGTDGVVIAAAQTVATVTTLTNLPAITTDWLTAAGVKADAVTKLQAGLALEATLTAIKGAGWSTETLAAIDVLIDAIKAKTDLIPASIPTAEQTADAVWDELLSGHVISGSAGAGLSTAAAGSAGAGAGANEVVITVDDGSNPLDGVEVWVTTDIAGSNTVASGISSVLGTVTVYLDGGTYYVWKQLAGYTFTNPETMVV